MIEHGDIKVSSPQMKYMGVGFIKSRKSDSKITNIKKEMLAIAISKSLHLVEIIIDSSSETVVEQHKIDSLIAWMEKDYINAIVVRSFSDITTDTEKLLSFMRKAEMLNISVYSIEAGMNLAYIPEDGGCGC